MVCDEGRDERGDALVPREDPMSDGRAVRLGGCGRCGRCGRDARLGRLGEQVRDTVGGLRDDADADGWGGWGGWWWIGLAGIRARIRAPALAFGAFGACGHRANLKV